MDAKKGKTRKESTPIKVWVVRAPGGALHVRDRCHQVERLSPKCHGVEKAHGADGNVDAGG